MTSCHILSPLINHYHTLSPIFGRKVMSMTTLNLVPSLLKILSYLGTYHNVLSQFITFYPPSLMER